MSWFWGKSEDVKKENIDIVPDPIKIHKRASINKSKQETIWIRTYGENYRVNCYVCDRNTITPTSSVVAHKTAIANGGTNDLNNLIHICSSCNSGMHKNNLEDYKKEINNV
mgnify:CR=1 FL=1